MLHKADLGAAAHLLEPGEPPAVRIEGGDDVGKAIAIDVAGKHLRAPFFVREEKGMGEPGNGFVGRLLPPAVVQDEIEPAIAIHVAHAGAVMELIPMTFGGDRSEVPRCGGGRPIGLNDTPLILPMGD